VPFSQGEFRKTVLNQIVFLGFLGSTFVRKVRGWEEFGWALDDDVSIFTLGDSPLK
jgi:hypothetical protein